MIKSVMDLALGLEPDLEPKLDKGSALRHIVGIEGVIESIEGLDEARRVPGVFEVTMLKNVGEEVPLLQEWCRPYRLCYCTG